MYLHGFDFLFCFFSFYCYLVVVLFLCVFCSHFLFFRTEIMMQIGLNFNENPLFCFLFCCVEIYLFSGHTYNYWKYFLLFNVRPLRRNSKNQEKTIFMSTHAFRNKFNIWELREMIISIQTSFRSISNICIWVFLKRR